MQAAASARIERSLPALPQCVSPLGCQATLAMACRSALAMAGACHAHRPDECTRRCGEMSCQLPVATYGRWQKPESQEFLEKLSKWQEANLNEEVSGSYADTA